MLQLTFQMFQTPFFCLFIKLQLKKKKLFFQISYSNFLVPWDGKIQKIAFILFPLILQTFTVTVFATSPFACFGFIFTFAAGSHGEHEGDEQVEQHPLPPFLIGEGGNHMTEGEVLL